MQPRRRRSPKLSPVVSAGIVLLSLCGCARKPAAPSGPRAPTIVRVRVAALAAEHPLYAEIGRLDRLAERTEGGRLSAADEGPVWRSEAREGRRSASAGQKPEANSAPAGSKDPATRALPGAGARQGAPAEVAAVIEEIRAAAGEASATREAAAVEADREASEPQAALVGGPLGATPEARRSAANRIREQASALATSVYDETVAACRLFAAQRNVVLDLGGQRPEATDVTELCRAWLREHWQAAAPAPS